MQLQELLYMSQTLILRVRVFAKSTITNRNLLALNRQVKLHFDFDNNVMVFSFIPFFSYKSRIIQSFQYCNYVRYIRVYQYHNNDKYGI